MKQNGFRLGFAAASLFVAVGMSAAAMADDRYRPDALLQVDTNRAAVVERIVATWSKDVPVAQVDSFKSKLNGLRADLLLAANVSGSFDGVLEVIHRAETQVQSPNAVKAKAVGESTHDLVYTPVTPCRFIDTRTAAGGTGPLATTGPERREFDVIASTFAAQGGSATNCAIDPAAVAIAVNLTAANATGAGNLRAFSSALATAPTTSNLNWAPATTQPSEANFAIVPICTTACPNGLELSILASSQVNVIADVMGYFMPPTRNGPGLRVIPVAAGSPAVINGDQTNAGAQSGTTIAGGSGNSISGADARFSTVGGGLNNSTQAFAATIAGGQSNTVGGSEGFIGAGLSNTVGSGFFQSGIVSGWQNTVGGNYAFVGAGARNAASSSNTVIGGGSDNTVTAAFGTIVGGSGGANGGFNAFMGSGGAGRASNCFNHATSTSGSPINDLPCWNELVTGANSAVLVGGYNNRNSNFTSVLVGGASNTVSQNDSALVGGWSNTINGQGFNAFIGAGNRNTTGGNASVIGGGSLNTITTAGSGAFVGAGRGNVVSGDRAVIVGGGSDSTNACYNHTSGVAALDGTCVNRAQGRRNFVGAGVGNETSGSESTAVGGFSNRATNNGAFVGGGFANTASGVASVVVGGGGTPYNCFNRATLANDAPCSNIASGENAFIGGGPGQLASGRFAVATGGVNNHATGERATVAGGNTNTASGLSSAVPGGRANWSAGAYSFTAGRGAWAANATAINDPAAVPYFGSFVWADTPDDGSGATPAATQNFRATTNNQFAVRSRGGVVFNVDNVTIAPDAGQVSGKCELPAGGAPTWSCTSDRNSKEAFTKVSPRDVLNKVVAMPMMTWQYKGVHRRHLSPMAQDFWQAFGLGVDDKQITSSDVSGVALAAIQGVNQKLNAEVTSLKEKNAKLERELAFIKKKLGL